MIKDISKIDVGDILSHWRWKVSSMKSIILMSELGDLFLLGNDNAVYWLQNGTGELDKVAEDLTQFEDFLSDEDKVEEWFIPLLIEELVASGKTLKEDEVYSFIKMPILGGEYVIKNFLPTNISIHFSFAGQICEQVKDLPDGTPISSIKLKR
jgi:hypothetical protein